jgi:molybdopterin molybdotransferase
VLTSGKLIEPHGIMGLAATGANTLPVRVAPRIAVISTGSELTSAVTPAHEGLICDSNGPYLEAVIRHIGATMSMRKNVPDSAGQLGRALDEAGADADIVLTTGGVSAGRFDLVPDAARAIGSELLFHKVSIRPGKPLLFARLPRGNLLFGLPGNPIAVAACTRFFVMQAIRRLQGLGPERPHPARLLESFAKPATLQFFGKAQALIDDEGQLGVRLLPGQESFKISPFVRANCWAILNAGQERFEAGELVQVAPLYPTGFLQG